jgi:hypothetical protein
MLNTKSIKKKPDYIFDITENMYKNEKHNENKRLEIEKKNIETNDSISSKEILKLHNQNLANNKQNIIEETNNSLKVNTIDEDNLINNELKGGFNPIKTLQSKPQIIVVAPKNILSDNKDDLYANWDEEKNSFMIYNNDDVIGYFNNNDILNSILKGVNLNKHIKKYFFIIAYNKETDTFEFNFLDTIFTDNLDLIIKVQNTLFDVVNQNNALSENDSDTNNLLTFKNRYYGN